MRAVLPYTAAQFARAIIMPNLVPPVVTTEDAKSYRDRIFSSIPENVDFTPLMTGYLTDNTDPEDLRAGISEKVFVGVKMYPANATTNSAHGVTDWRKTERVLAVLEETNTPLLVHGEVTDQDVDIFDREKVFIDEILLPLSKKFSTLKIVLEHVTTKDGVDFVKEGGTNIAATITPHHLVINRNEIFRGGIRPHLYCLPIAKREKHRLALRAAAVSGKECFFLGTDSAPHPISSKESECGCAGIFNAPTALEIYAQVFDEENALDRFEKFASFNGPNFYNLPVNDHKITLSKQGSESPDLIEISSTGDQLMPFLSGKELPWKVI
jgi:dihydroorotase